MNNELNDLKNKYPIFLSKLDYINCDSGWSSLLESVFSQIERHIMYSVPEEMRKDVFAVQVKEKFGGLRIYCNNTTDFIQGVIDLAEDLSVKTCEVCGFPGTIKNISYIKTLCDTCFNNRLNKKI